MKRPKRFHYGFNKSGWIKYSRDQDKYIDELETRIIALGGLVKPASSMETDEQLEEFVKGLDENIESVTTCLAQYPEGKKEHGVVLTIKGVDVVLLQSDLEEIAEYLGSLPIL